MPLAGFNMAIQTGVLREIEDNFGQDGIKSINANENTAWSLSERSGSRSYVRFKPGVLWPPHTYNRRLELEATHVRGE